MSSITRPFTAGPSVNAPLLLERFNRRKRNVTGRWHIDETYIKVRGQWMYLYRAIDSVGDTVEFWFSEQRDLPSAKRFFRKTLARHGRPDRVVIDGSQPTTRLSFPVTPQIAYWIALGAG